MGNRITESIISVSPPSGLHIRTVRMLIGMGLLSMSLFIWWFADPDHVGYAPVFWLLSFALLFKLVKMLHEWYHYWSPSVPVMPVTSRFRTVDMLTTACPGEPVEMIIRTLKAMVAVRYPHTNYLCDEGNDPQLKKICEELGVIHVTRTLKVDAKAGNINHALQQATGEICVILDPDHVPIPQFLDRVVPYFEDEKVGFVQCVQAYGNQQESFIARGAAEQTYHFYGPMMMCMNTYGTVQAIGANCTFRRKALDSIGGHAAGLSEDMHTAMQLHAKGWTSVYVPEILTRGLVPATLSAYYKQQLKWSRGTFELLFRTYPNLKQHFTWRQKIHYFTIPLYFLFGLINLVDIAVPLLALTLAETPWEINLGVFALYYLPLLGIALAIRLYAQRWLLEKHERGFHFAGGILRMATWWIFLIGFAYTIFKIKVPYIPTPKEDAHQNYLRLSVPNIITLLFAAGLVYYGLSIDWTPYSIAMSSYSLMTAGMLGFTVLMSQQRFLTQSARFCRKIPALRHLAAGASFIGSKSQQLACRLLSNSPLVLLIASSLLLISYNSVDYPNAEEQYSKKEPGGFYLGAGNQPGDRQGLPYPFSVVPVEMPWPSADRFGGSRLLGIRDSGAIPHLRWQIGGPGDGAGTLKDLCDSKYDSYLQSCAGFFRAFRDPVFISVHETGNPAPAQFVAAWQYLYTFFNDLGISNLTWVWCPAGPDDAASYPGDKFVDWLGVSCLNYGEHSSKTGWYSFNALYAPYREAYGSLRKPVMITSLGSAGGAGQQAWLTDAFEDIRKKFREIRSAVLFTGNIRTARKTDSGVEAIRLTDFSIQDDQTCQLIREALDDAGAAGPLPSIPGHSLRPQQNYDSPFITGGPGSFEMLINGRPFYIRGVAYNTAHDWRDGHMPLSRRQLVKDFEKIKAMGANTIRRYGTGIYDRNVLNIAGEFNLSVLYGFWFDPKTDFYADAEKVESYMEEVEEEVLRYKDHKAILAWSLGNETWGLLKHSFAKPYLVQVRTAYVQMIERLAQRIHELDPTRPVFTCIEHEKYQLPGELVAFRDGAPSVDVIGVNSYYRQQIAALNHVVWQFDSTRPYLVSEFGPAGYWDPEYNTTRNGSLIEQSDKEKADWYGQQWTTYVKGYQGYNVGGFAYCWHDRMEGSYTWFGLTDFMGRPKPSYYALRELWTQSATHEMPQLEIIAPGPLLPGHTYTLSARARGLTSGAWKAEWRLLKNEYLEDVKHIEVTDDFLRILLTVPEEPSNYRLYLHVSDANEQWVSTASLPVKVTENKP